MGQIRTNYLQIKVNRQKEKPPSKCRLRHFNWHSLFWFAMFFEAYLPMQEAKFYKMRFFSECGT